MEPKVKKSLVLPDGLAKRADAAAAEELRSFNGYVIKLLADQLGWQPPVGESVEADEVAS